jgi:Carboxypeptidase regulatory-like domain
MTLAIKSAYGKELQYKLSSIAALIIIFTVCLGIGSIIAISSIYRSTSTPILSPQSSEEIISPLGTDLGSVNGFVMSSDGLPISGASVLVYKHMGLTGSTEKNLGYSTSVTTNSDGAYLFNALPSGLYKFTVTYPNGVVQIIDNYAVWPSSSSSYNFRANSLLIG